MRWFWRSSRPSELTRRPGADAEIGGFGGLFDLKAAGFKDPILVAANDGVGTKLKIAIESGRFDTIGIDLVAMCVNDIVVQGAEPLFFLDYFATGKLDPAQGAAIVAGIAKACVESGCALIGGETAEMPGIYAKGDFDLAGFAVGAAERGTLLPRGKLAAGDAAIGLVSSGPHSNGYSLIRRIVERYGAILGRAGALRAFAFPWRSAADADKTLRKAAARCAQSSAGTLGVRPCHRRRIFRQPSPGAARRSSASISNSEAFAPPPVFGWLKAMGGVDDHEMLRTFNCGLWHGRLRQAGVGGRNFCRARGGKPRAEADWPAETALRPARRHPWRGRLVTLRVKVAVLISGRGSNMAALIDAARAKNYPAEIKLVVSNKADAPGLEKARAAGVEAIALNSKDFADKDAFEAAIDRELRKRDIEIICLAGYMRILGAAFVERWRGRILNIHPSLLPAYKGLGSPRARARRRRGRARLLRASGDAGTR